MQGFNIEILPSITTLYYGILGARFFNIENLRPFTAQLYRIVQLHWPLHCTVRLHLSVHCTVANELSGLV
jgi:hypothetical protein